MPRTDVLIAGSGSAGIFAATWLAIYNIPFTILESRPGPLQIGQADGVQCRTVEIYESFGLSEDLLREAHHILEVCFWGVDETNPTSGGITRKSRSIDTERGLSHLPHVILNQARMNGLMVDKMQHILKQSNGRGELLYDWKVNSVQVDSEKTGDPDAFCCEVTAENEGKVEVWQAKYVLGCDGAHSTVRKALGYQMLGDTSDTVWGVMDIFPRTSFPDIRKKCTIHSSTGNLIIIPREGGQLTRFYIQLPAGIQARQVTLRDLQDTTRKIFAPYTMDFADVFWWSAYSIGQRVAEQFHKDYRVFLTGDAAHTHSPKAGQGMNVSLQDGYNIGWKLGSVLRGISPPSVLHTYVSERSKTAADLIEFDKVLAAMFSRKEQYPGEFSEYFIKSGRYMAGFTATYDDAPLTSCDNEGGCCIAKGVVVGMRFPSAQVIRLADCKAVPLQKVLQSDGRWRVVIFGGDINVLEHKMKLDELAWHLERLVQRYTLEAQDIDSLIEPILVLSSKYLETEQETIPDYFSPVSGKYKIKDLHKTYIDDEHYNSGHGHAYETYGVDPNTGAVVIVRPDQYVSKTTTVDDFDGIAEFFQGCLIERNVNVTAVARL